MKTTIDFPDDLLHRAKIVAAQRQTTLKEIVLQGVDYMITHPLPQRDPDSARRAEIKKLLTSMKASNTHPMRPLTREEIYAQR